MSILESPFVVLIAIVVVACFVGLYYVAKGGVDEVAEGHQALRVAGLYREYVGTGRCLPVQAVEMADVLDAIESATGDTFEFEDPDAWRIQFGKSDRSHGLVTVYRVDSSDNRFDVHTKVLETAPGSAVDSVFHDVLDDARDCP